MKPGCIKGHLIDLYPLAIEHIDSYLRSYSSLVRTLLHVYDLQQEFLYLHDCLKYKSFFYIIAEKSLKNVIGGIEIRRPEYRSQLYCWLHECYWGNGYFQEAMKLVADTYFKITGCCSIMARVDCKNGRSIQALKKLGFQEQKVVSGPHGPQQELLLKKE